MSIRTNQLLNQNKPSLRPMAPQRQRGAIAIMAVVLLPVLLAVGALVIDIANLILVKGELQNAADSAAQAGAQCLYPRAGETNCGVVLLTERPNFGAAKDKANDAATSATQGNAVQGRLVTDAVVDVGYWNVERKPDTLQDKGITPKAEDYPAVQVTISKESGKNGGGVLFYLAKIMALFGTTGSAAMGLDSANISATAVSVVTPPGSLPPGSLFPFAMARCMYDAYWNSADGTPIKDPNTGKAYVFYFGSDEQKLPDGITLCAGGQFVGFDPNNKNPGAGYIKTLISEIRNDASLAIGDTIYIGKGKMDGLFKDTEQCRTSTSLSPKPCPVVNVPITVNPTPDPKKLVQQDQAILGFGCIHILSSNKGAKPYMEVQMANDCPPPQGSGTGPDDGVHNPPRLAF